MASPIVTWLRTPRIRRGLAASTVLLAAGGLILFRAPSSLGGPGPNVPPAFNAPLGQGTNFTTFSAPGAHGQVSLSHARLLAGTPTRVFAEVRIIADAGDRPGERAPISMAIVLDTSGSMEGEKIQQAKDSVIRLIRDMRDDDEVAFIRYADDASVLQPLTRVGNVRSVLIDQIRAIQAGGGTAIPRGLSAGLAQLEVAGRGRVRRVVLASDGLDSTRGEAERLASSSFEHGITVSSMGIGLDFDESYMGGVARAGHGNFAFVKDASALSGFLKQELVETATTSIETATVRLQLPPGMRFVRAIGADARVNGTRWPGGANVASDIDLSVGSLFAGDERRVIVEMEGMASPGEKLTFSGNVSWNRVGGAHSDVGIGLLALVGTTDPSAVEAGRDGRVLASATSVTASTAQLEAAEAYQKGDVDKAQRLMDQSILDLQAAATTAPAPAASALERQWTEYKARKAPMSKPGSGAGNMAAKKAAATDNNNLVRSGF
jgi:Ca-activated chloride channel family protein